MEVFLPFAALPRSIVGYCAHWRESLADPDTKIIRPQQDYKGVWLRHYADVNARTAEGERRQETEYRVYGWQLILMGVGTG